VQDKHQQPGKQDELRNNQDGELKRSDFFCELLQKIFQITVLTAEIMMGQFEAALTADEILALKTTGTAWYLGMILAVFFFHIFLRSLALG
jgi:hypothetical protein